MLQRKYSEGRKYYLRALEVSSVQTDFYDGIIADFNMFIENGWAVDKLKQEIIHLTNQWNKHYKFKTIGNEYFVKGQELENNGLHLEAGIAFDSAISNELRGNYVRYGILCNYHRWSAYDYYMHKDFETSLARYTTGWDINLKHMNDPELEMVDLDMIRVLNSLLHNDVMEEMYEKMKFAAQRKLQSNPQSNDLYFISIETNGSSKKGYVHAANDANKMAKIVGERAQLIFDTSYMFVLNQDVPDTVTSAFEHVVKRSKIGDCFILFYTGFTTDNKLIIGIDTILNEQIVAWLSSMSASKKLLIIDAANSSIINKYTKSQQGNIKEFQAESVGFLISDGRVELPSATASLFTLFLTSGISGEAATHWQSSLIKDSSESLAYITSKSLEGFMYGNMSSGNLQFDLKSYSAGVDYPLTFVNASAYSTDTTPPMIYIPNVISSDGSRGGKTKVVTLSKNIGGQALDQSGIEEITINGHSVTFSQNGKFNLDQNFSREWTKLVITARDRMGNTASDSFIVNISK
ncbi:MAG: hypothetical protein ACI9UJ_000310 [bacterium]|jgi:hypothetical protein